jgi:hypothetical protein
MIALHVRRRAPQPTVVFDEMWRLACERQRIYYRRMAGNDAPWTSDVILQQHRFTNAYRAADRVSQFLIREIQYAGRPSIADVVLRTLLFKIFNRIDTWKLIDEAVGAPVAADLQRPMLADALDRALASGTRLYSAAYIMPSPGFGQARKHRNHLLLLAFMLKEGLVDRLGSSGSLEEAFLTLKGYPSLGDFLAYQFAIDLNYSPALNFSEMDFVVAGPGAREGIRKCFSSLGDLTDADVIRWAAETQADHFARMELEFLPLFGRPLQLIDVQNLFCEVAKYARLSHPQFTLPGGRQRLKQRYRGAGTPPVPFFPPRWGLTECNPQYASDSIEACAAIEPSCRLAS